MHYTVQYRGQYHFLACLWRLCTRQGLQKVCPQPIVTGSTIRERQIEHSSIFKSSSLTVLPLGLLFIS